jgi:hypothetical protein
MVGLSDHAQSQVHSLHCGETEDDIKFSCVEINEICLSSPNITVEGVPVKVFMLFHDMRQSDKRWVWSPLVSPDIRTRGTREALVITYWSPQGGTRVDRRAAGKQVSVEWNILFLSLTLSVLLHSPSHTAYTRQSPCSVRVFFMTAAWFP